MNLLFLSHRFYRDSDIRMSYGAWVTVYKLARELAKRIDLTVIAGGKGNETIENINVVRVPVFGTEMFKDYCLSYNIMALNKMSKYNFDLAHSHGIDGALAFKLMRKEMPKISTIFALTKGHMLSRGNLRKNLSLKESFISKSNNFWEKMMIDNSDAFFTLSKFSKDETKRLTGVKKDISIVYNGTDVNQFKPLSSEAGQTALFMGGTSRRKGIDIMLKSYVTAKKKHPDLKLLIVGAKSLGKYSSLVPREFQKDIKLLGSIKNSKLPEVYSNCNFLAFPSFHETLAAAPLESMACERPVVAFNTTALPEEVTNKEGILVKTGNVEEFSNAMISLLDYPKRAKMLGRNGRKRVKKRFTIEKLADRHIKNYKRFI